MASGAKTWRDHSISSGYIDLEFSEYSGFRAGRFHVYVRDHLPLRTTLRALWGSCQIHKIVGCACSRKSGNVFPATAGRIFKCIFLNANIWISIKIVPMDPMSYIPALFQRMAWRQLSEPMMANLLTHICVTRSQWVDFMLGISMYLMTYIYIYHQPCIHDSYMQQMKTILCQYWCVHRILPS